MDLLNAKVLIVDDEEVNVRLLEGILKREGYVRLKSTMDARQAVPLFVEFQPDLILLDLMMPHLDGFSIMRQLLKLIPAETFLPILVLTADTTAETKLKALAGGANDFLTKPLDVVETIIRIRNLLTTRMLHLQLQNQNVILEDKVRRRTSMLRESEKKYRLLIDNIPAVVWIADQTGQVSFIAPNIERYSGYTAVEVCATGSQLWFDRIHPDDAARVRSDYEDFHIHGNPYNVEYRYQRKDGEWIWLHAHAVWLYADAGTQYAYGFITNATARKRAEEELHRYHENLEMLVEERTSKLRDSEAWFRVLFDSGNDAILVHSVTDDGGAGRFLEANRVACERLGYTRAELLNLTPLDIDDGDKAARQRATKQLGDKVSAVFETVYHAKNGALIPVEINARQFELNGKPLVLEIVRDIADRKTLEASLLQAKVQAEHANRAKSVFLANMSHEIRTPMNAILGFSQVLMRDPQLTPAQRQHLDTINRCGEHLLALINDILELSKIEAGRLILNPVPFDLRMLVQDLAAMLRAPTEDKHLKFLLTLNDDLPRYVIADEGKLRQVFVNLLGNAIKFTREGGIALRVGIAQNPAGHLRLVVEIKDSGPGISETEMALLFRQFEQTSTGSQIGGGTGLGLALSREYVRAMGGDLSVTSQVGCGSCFHFEVDIQESASSPGSCDPGARSVVALLPGRDSFRILVVDDQADNRMLLTAMLQPVGFEVREAIHGGEAVALNEQWAPHLILMDIRMPVMDGIEAIQRIRAARPGEKKPAIVALTASAFEEARKTILDAGADYFLRKPFKECELFETIQKYLDVQYVYAGDRLPETESLTPAAISLETASAVAKLPQDLVEQISQAAIRADFFRLQALMEEVARHDAPLAGVLKRLTSSFAYETLLKILKSNNPI